MNLTVKKEWHDAARTIKDAGQRRELYEIIARYFFDGEEPGEGESPALLVFTLIRGEIDRQKRGKARRDERKDGGRQRPRGRGTPPAVGTKDERTATARKTGGEARFMKPTVEEIAAFIKEKGYRVNAGHFFNYYEANGWRVGRNPMKNWRAAVTNWEGNNLIAKEKTDGGAWQKEHGAADEYMGMI